LIYFAKLNLISKKSVIFADVMDTRYRDYVSHTRFNP